MTFASGILIGAIATSVVAYIVYLIIEKKKKSKTVRDGPKGKGRYVEELGTELSPEGQKLWIHLLSINMGNKKRARDFINYERKFTKNASIEELIKAAIDRWIKDNK